MGSRHLARREAPVGLTHSGAGPQGIQAGQAAVAALLLHAPHTAACLMPLLNCQG